MTNFRGRPFVYLSEAVLTPPHGLSTIAAVAGRFNGQVNAELLDQVYKQAALSVKAQAQLFQSTTKFRPAQHREWLGGIASTVSDAIKFGSSGDRQQFLAALPSELARAQNYHMPDHVRNFITNLESRAVLWGIIANEGPMYPAVLKYLRVRPFCTVQAREGVFKPLPITLHKALEKVPRDSRNNVIYVGSAEVPYDNMFVEGARSVLLGSVSDGPAGFARNHSRIASLDELFPLLDQPGAGPETEFDFEGLIHDDDDSVVLSSFRPNQLLPLGERDRGLADYEKDDK